MIKWIERYDGCVAILMVLVVILVFSFIPTPHLLRSRLPLDNVVQIKVVSTEIDWYTGEFLEWQGTGVFIRDDYR